MNNLLKSLVLACLLCSLFVVYGCDKKEATQPVTPAPAGMAESSAASHPNGKSGTVASHPAVETPAAAISEAVEAVKDVVKEASEAVSEAIESATH